MKSKKNKLSYKKDEIERLYLELNEVMCLSTNEQYKEMHMITLKEGFRESFKDYPAHILILQLKSLINISKQFNLENEQQEYTKELKEFWKKGLSKNS